MTLECALPTLAFRHKVTLLQEIKKCFRSKESHSFLHPLGPEHPFIPPCQAKLESHFPKWVQEALLLLSTLFIQHLGCPTLFQRVLLWSVVLYLQGLLVVLTKLLNSHHHSSYQDRYQDLAVLKVFHHMTKLSSCLVQRQ